MPVGTPKEVAALRAQLWDAGFRPVPIYNHDSDHPSAGKAPMGDAWGAEARRDPPSAATGAAHPRALNTGVLCDGLRAIDIDIDNPTIAASVRAKALDRFGEAPMRYRGNSPRVLLLYRAAEGAPPKRSIIGPMGKVEVLGRGQQFVAFGVHPSGADLQWMPEAPGAAMLGSLTAITEAEIDDFFADAAPSIGATLLPKSSAGEPAPSSRGLGADALQVVAALSAIPNNGPADWEGWNRIGMATWAATGGGEAGRAAFHAWSQLHPSYDAAATNERWDHYRTSPPTQIGAGTLFYLAKQAAPPQRVAPDIAEPRDEPAHAGDTFDLLWFDDIRPMTDARDFVQGTLIEGSAAVLYGESNSGKTFLATDLALCVASGIPWNGKRVEQGGVVYVVLEGGQGFLNRVSAWREAHDTLEGPVHFAALRHSVNLLDPAADTHKLIATVRGAAKTLPVPVKLIVIDTLSRALAGGNENSPEDMGALVVNMDRIRAQTGASTLFVHHSGKDAAKGARGHSLLRAAIDTEIEVVDTEGARTATVVKQRDLKKGDTHQFTLDVIEIGTNRHGEPVTTCLVKFSDGGAYAGASLHHHRLPQSQQRALEVLADLVAAEGRSGHAGTPAGIPSVPEKWWRERFYDRAMPGAEQKTKEKAFRRAADALVTSHFAGMSAGRVWVVRHTTERDQQAV